MSDKGIVIIAAGKPTYGIMAYNLAISIKHFANIPIHLVCTLGAIETVPDITLFNTFEIADPKDYEGGYQRLKLCLDKYSPFDRTLFLDADTIITRDITPLFNQKYKFQIGVLGDTPNYKWWGDKEKIHERYGEGYLPKTYSGIIYFEDREIFPTARKIYDNYDGIVVKWRGGLPDEYCFNVAILIHKLTMIKKYMPIFFVPYHEKQTAYELVKKNYGFTISGLEPSGYLEHVYAQQLRLMCFEKYEFIMPGHK